MIVINGVEIDVPLPVGSIDINASVVDDIICINGQLIKPDVSRDELVDYWEL